MAMPDTGGLDLLIVDDDDAGRRMLRRALERRGHRVTEAGDGRQGLDTARSDHPDIVFLDLRMPGELSGFDVARELASEPSTARIPVVIVSASVHADARKLARDIGVAGFIEKPVDFNEVYQLLESVRSSG